LRAILTWASSVRQNNSRWVCRSGRRQTGFVVLYRRHGLRSQDRPPPDSRRKGRPDKTGLGLAAARFSSRRPSLRAPQASSPSQGSAGAPEARPSKQWAAPISHIRVFKGRQRKMIAFPLGGVSAASISLGGRGKLRDREIIHKPDKGGHRHARFRASGRRPAKRSRWRAWARQGVGSRNAPGLVRPVSATFTGEFPVAGIDFEDRALPVRGSTALRRRVGSGGVRRQQPPGSLKWKVRPDLESCNIQ